MTPFLAPRASTPRYVVLPSAMCELTLLGDGAALTAVYLGSKHRHAPPVAAEWTRTEPDRDEFAEPARQLTEYLAGTRREFNLPLAPTGTPFQLRVWAALLDIPYGETTSYGALAGELGLGPAGSRAVGAANGRNPISIVVLCHRVIGAGGALVGYGGGLPTKRALLDLERQDQGLFAV